MYVCPYMATYIYLFILMHCIMSSVASALHSITAGVTLLNLNNMIKHRDANRGPKEWLYSFSKE